jgi:trigger factor
LVAAAHVPAPEGIVSDGVTSRKDTMIEQLSRVGLSLEEYLSAEGKTEADLDAEMQAAAQEETKFQLLLDAFADQEEIEVSTDEYGQEVVAQARRAGVPPQQFYDQLNKAGMAASLYAEVRRNKALARVLEQVTIKDSAGALVSLEASAVDDVAHDHSDHVHDHDHAEDDHDHDHDQADHDLR